MRLLRLRKDSGDDSPKHDEDADEEDDEEIGKALPLWSPERCKASLILDPVLETLILGKEADIVKVGSQSAIDLLVFLMLCGDFKT